jgi:hypothetical protein
MCADISFESISLIGVLKVIPSSVMPYITLPPDRKETKVVKSSSTLIPSVFVAFVNQVDDPNKVITTVGDINKTCKLNTMNIIVDKIFI